MSWLLKKGSGNYPSRLRALLEGEETLLVPGAHEPLFAMLAKREGFGALYLSGAALSASRGLPDLGILTMAELVHTTSAIVRAADLPLIVDGDTGYGETLNVLRLVSELEEAGAAAVQIEDQEMPKRCGHLEGKHLVTVDEMESRLRAALRARGELLVVARTDARGVTGLEDAIARARRYESLGADVIFPEGLQTEEEFAAFREAVKVPLLANMTEFGKTPYLSAARFKELGYDIVIYPVSSLRLAARAAAEGFAALRQEGTLEGQLPKMLTRQELYDVIGYEEHESLARGLQESSEAEEGY